MCSSCKKELPFGGTFYKCSVSTCNRARMPLTFCSVSCFEAHVPVVRHREAWAEEETAPTKEAWLREQAEEAAADAAAVRRAEPSRAEPGAGTAPEANRERRIVGVGAAKVGPVALNDLDVPRDILIVVSKLKTYIRARSGMNTSDGVMDVLSDIVRELCDAAVQRAAQEGRKTVMDRDF